MFIYILMKVLWKILKQDNIEINLIMIIQIKYLNIYGQNIINKNLLFYKEEVFMIQFLD